VTVHCVVPNVVGKTLSATRRALARRHCRLGRVGHAFSIKRKKGLVISQKPRAGSRRAKGAKVSVVVSKGRR
jgi:beta-lactam-binding protein with PASTA domain